jgi:serine-type D-Ala-D-Ala carboxypeptidase (penicillin-binding protein 5/6)
MVPILSAIVVLLISIHLVMGFDEAAILVQSSVSAGNVPNNKVSEEVETITQPIIPLPPKPLGIGAPTLSAASSLVKDVSSGALLYTKNEHKRVPIASTTKIMTAVVGTAHFKPNDVLEVISLKGVSGATMGLTLGERISFRSLLYGMLLNSGNDAAYTIAHNYPGGYKSFIDAMNSKAKELGLENTHFDNPAGFDSPNHYSSAFDLSIIAGHASENVSIMKVVGTKEAQVGSVNGDEIHNLKNLNKLLNTPGVIGFKTGFTPVAKENFVGLIERDGHKIITVVLGSNDRFGETLSLINWAYSNFSWE